MKKILVYRMKGEKRKRLKKICGELEIDLSVVSPAEYGEAIGALVGFPGMRKQGCPRAGTGVAGEMLVFCGLDDMALEEFLDACKGGSVEPTACKAVLTPYNAGWSSEKLYAELVRESE